MSDYFLRSYGSKSTKNSPNKGCHRVAPFSGASIYTYLESEDAVVPKHLEFIYMCHTPILKRFRRNAANYLKCVLSLQNNDIIVAEKFYSFKYWAWQKATCEVTKYPMNDTIIRQFGNCKKRLKYSEFLLRRR